MFSNVELTRIIEKFSQRITAEDDKLLSDWIAASAENKLLFETLQKIWDNTPGKIHHPEPDTEAEWLRLHQKIQTENKTVSIKSNFRWHAMAASVALLTLAGLYIFRKPAAEFQAITFSATDKVIDFYLPDSSRVWLNLNSELSYKEDFGRRRKEVILKGEGYFLVRPDTIPFSVETSLATVRVLGTEFNVKSTHSSAVVSVSKGRVEVEGGGTKMEVTKGQSATVSDNRSIKTLDTVADIAPWRGIRDNGYVEELRSPDKFLIIENTHRKNKIDQTVVEGSITNSATQTTYRKFELKITYVKSNGRSSILIVPIDGPLKPGERISYRKRLPDLFSKTRPVKVEIGKVELH